MRIWNQNRRVYGWPRLHAELRGSRGTDEPEACGSIDEGSRDPAGEPEAPESRAHPEGPEGASGTGLGEPELHSRGTRSALGGGSDVCAYPGGLVVRGPGPGRLEPLGRGLGDGDASALRAGGEGACHGSDPAAAEAGDPPLGPGNAVHLGCLWRKDAGRRECGRRWAP